MKRILVIFGMVLVFIPVGLAGGFVEDSCACGGGPMVRFQHYQGPYVEYHWDCFWPQSGYTLHGC